jgi:hypothetical protein
MERRLAESLPGDTISQRYAAPVFHSALKSIAGLVRKRTDGSRAETYCLFHFNSCLTFTWEETMDTDEIHQAPCAVCARPVDLRRVVTDEKGRAMHEDCYARVLVVLSTRIKGGR